MSNFKVFSKAVYKKFNEMSKGDLFVVDVDSYELTDFYLDSFPAGTNEIFRERREYDCSCCKSFIRNVGNVVAIKGNELITIWDVNVPYPFDVVCKSLSEKIKSEYINSIFLHKEKRIGTEFNHEQLDTGDVKRWDHFYCDVPNKFISNNIGENKSRIESAVSVFERGLNELTLDALETVKKLITSKSLYRGEEHLNSVNAFIELKKQYITITDDKEKNIFIWKNHTNHSIRFKNTVIGTLVSDLSDGKDIEIAVSAFESKVAPVNYKRSSAIITPRMVEKAMSTINSLGIEESLYRRHAVVDDVKINDVIWANRSTKNKMKDGGLTELLMKEVVSKAKIDESKINDITIDDFINEVVPNSTSIKMLVGNKHTGNLMTVTAPKFEDSKNIFKWDNNFAWSYNGDVTDSLIKDRVKKAGGNVNAKFRVSLSWFNYDDLDIHCITPSGKHIYFSNKSGILDVDMNAGGDQTREPVENLAFNSFEKGTYKVYVHNYNKRESNNVGFVVETEYNGDIETFTYNKAVGDTKKIDVIEFTSDGKSVTIDKVHSGIEKGSSSKDVWGIKTETFVDVNMLMYSPNHWDGDSVGNKHYFFIMENCKNPDLLRGIYNEFLTNELNEYRKVFEVLGDKTKCEYSDNQLSGLGFSSTKRDNVVVKVEGKQNRMYNVVF